MVLAFYQSLYVPQIDITVLFCFYYYCKLPLLREKNIVLKEVLLFGLSYLLHFYQLHYFMSNFDEFTRSRYAQMQSSIFNRTGSSIVSGGGNSKLNLTGKFGSIEQQVKHIEVETHALTQAGHESARVVEQMRRVVADKELNECQGKCVQEVKKYERVVSYGIAENDQRTEQLWQKCKSLSNSTEELKQSIARLHSKINKLQNVLGYYNGAEIVSNY